MAVEIYSTQCSECVSFLGNVYWSISLPRPEQIQCHLTQVPISSSICLPSISRHRVVNFSTWSWLREFSSRIKDKQVIFVLFGRELKWNFINVCLRTDCCPPKPRWVPVVSSHMIRTTTFFKTIQLSAVKALSIKQWPLIVAKDEFMKDDFWKSW